MQLIPLGTKGRFELVVEPRHLADRFKDVILPPIFATPMMILVMENAALNAVREFLDSGETALGTKIDVHHSAATPVGHRVQAEAEVVKVEEVALIFAARRGTRPKRSGAVRTSEWSST